MNLQALKTELQTDPLGIGYAAHLPHATGKVAELLNAQTRSIVKRRYITTRGILDKWPTGPNDAGVFLNKLEALAPNVPALKWSFKFLLTDEGLDIGTATAQAMIAQLPAIPGGGITNAEAQALADMAKLPGSRAEELFGAAVAELDVIGALQ